MKVINLFASPGVGKSTVSAGLFYKFKTETNYNVELVTEYAKDLVWERRQDILSYQVYLLAKQNQRLRRLRGKVDIAITDSPILMQTIYHDNSSSYLTQLTKEIFDSYDNVNYLLRRKLDNYQETGRLHNKEQSEELQKNLVNMLDATNTPYFLANINQHNFLNELFDDVLRIVKNG